MDMFQDIRDKDGNIIGAVRLYHWEMTFGDGRGNRLTEKHDDLTQADFSGMNLQNADFRGLDLFAADFRHADLRGADFRGARATMAHFYGANLEGADFRGADVSDTLKMKDLEGIAVYDEETRFYKTPVYHRPSWM